MHKLIMEFTGTFLLVLTIGMNTLLTPEGQGPFTPLVIGAALAALMCAGLHVSGGHFNPAVSVGVLLRGRLKAAELPGYLVSQLLGAAAASLAVLHLKGEGGVPPAAEAFAAGEVILAEFLYTFALVLVYLNVTTARGNPGNPYAGPAVGLTLMVAHYSVGAISGGSFNPVAAVGACLMRMANWSTLWAYFAPQLLAGVAAAYAFRLTHPGDAGRAEKG